MARWDAGDVAALVVLDVEPRAQFGGVLVDVERADLVVVLVLDVATVAHYLSCAYAGGVR